MTDKLKIFFLTLVGIAIFLIQSSPLFNQLFLVKQVKPNLLYVYMVFIALYFPYPLGFIFILTGGFFTDALSNAPGAFYMISFFLSILPLFILKEEFNFSRLPFFMSAVIIATIIKAVVIMTLSAISGLVVSTKNYFLLIVLLEIILNTLTAIPLYMFFYLLKIPDPERAG